MGQSFEAKDCKTLESSITVKELLERAFEEEPMTSNKLRSWLGIEHTEQCRRWLRGTHKPSEMYIKRISDVCGYRYEDLLRIIRGI